MKTQSFSKILVLLLVVFAWMANPIQVQAQSAVHTEVDEMPVPPGGMEGFTKYMMETLSYPELAKESKIEGMVVVKFVVKEDGSVNTVKVIRGIGGGCDEEAVRVVENSGIWTPGEKGGKVVATEVTLPVKFKL